MSDRAFKSSYQKFICKRAKELQAAEPGLKWHDARKRAFAETPQATYRQSYVPDASSNMVDHTASDDYEIISTAIERQLGRKR